MIRLSKKKLVAVVAIAALAFAGLAFGEDVNNYLKGITWARGGLYIGPNVVGLARATSPDKITASYGGSASITPGSITAPACADQGTTIAVIGASGTGAKVGDACDLGEPAPQTANINCKCSVTAAGVATVRCCALVTGTPAAGLYYARTWSQQ